MTAKRNRRAGVEDLWRKSDGAPSKLNGAGLRWRARYVDESGAERSKRFRAKAGAQTWLDSQTAAIVTGTYVDPRRSAVTVRELAEGWYASKADLTPKTKLSYRSLLDTLVLPQWGDRAVRDVDHNAVQVWIAKLRTGGVRFAHRPLSASRVIQAHNVLSAVLDRAVRQRYLTSNPAKAVELPRKPVGDRRYLTHGEVEALADAIGDEYRLLVLTFAYTGLRWGEAVALRARNVNTERGRIEVVTSVTRVGSQLVEGDPKTHARRSVPVPDFLCAKLGSALAGSDGDALVFPGPDGKTLVDNYFRYRFDQATKRAGVAGLVPHELRHTAASIAIASGANIKAVQRMLGHATATMTLDKYGHLYDDDLTALATAVSRSRAYSLRTGADNRTVVPMRTAR